MLYAVFHFMPCISLYVLDEPPDRESVERLGSVFKGVALINVRNVCVPLFGVQRRSIRSSIGYESLVSP